LPGLPYAYKDIAIRVDELGINLFLSFVIKMPADEKYLSASIKVGGSE
jgi:hypothetical protein